MRAPRGRARAGAGAPLWGTRVWGAPVGSFHPLLPRAHFGAGVLLCGSPLAHGEVAGSGFGVVALLCADVDTDGGVCAAPGAQGRMRGSGLGSAAGSFRASFPGHGAGCTGSSDPAAPHRELWGLRGWSGGSRGDVPHAGPSSPRGGISHLPSGFFGKVSGQEQRLPCIIHGATSPGAWVTAGGPAASTSRPDSRGAEREAGGSSRRPRAPRPRAMPSREPPRAATGATHGHVPCRDRAQVNSPPRGGGRLVPAAWGIAGAGVGARAGA